jgi:hypothetical protein
MAAMVLAGSTTSCITTGVTERAKPWKTTNEKGETVETKPAQPGYYALLPLSVPADIALSPIYAIWWLAMTDFGRRPLN